MQLPKMAGGVIRRRRRGRGAPNAPLFRLASLPTLGVLPCSEFSYDPRAWFNADGAGGMATVAGPTLAESGAGASPEDAGDWHPFFQATDYATTFVGANILEEASAGSYFGDHDHAKISICLRLGDTPGGIIAGSRVGAGGTAWWAIYDPAGASDIAFYMHDGTTTVHVDASSSDVIRGAWNFIEVYFDRTQSTAADSAQCFVNGEASGVAVDFSALSGAVDGTYPLSIGGYSGGTLQCDSTVAMLGIYAENDLGFVGSGNAAQWLTHHKMAFSRLTGSFATATGTGTPVVMSRASARHVRKDDASGNTTLVQVAPNWPAACRVWDGAALCDGLMNQDAATNLVPYSDDITNAAWAKAQITEAADGESAMGRTRYSLTGNATSNSHHIVDNVSLTNGVQYVFSAIVEAGTLDYAWLRLDCNGAQGVSFNLATGAYHSTILGSPEAYGIDHLYGDTYLIWMRDTAVGTAARSAYLGISGNGDRAAAADGVVYCHGGFQIEAGDLPTSRTYTAGASATRAEEVLYHKADDGSVDTSGIRAVVDATFTQADAGPGTLLELNTSGAAVERISVSTDASGHVVLTVIDASTVQASITGTTDIRDGTRHSIEAIILADDVRLRVDGVVEGTPDTSADMPTGLDRIVWGNDYNGGDSQAHAVVSAKIYAA